MIINIRENPPNYTVWAEEITTNREFKPLKTLFQRKWFPRDFRIGMLLVDPHYGTQAERIDMSLNGNLAMGFWIGGNRSLLVYPNHTHLMYDGTLGGPAFRVRGKGKVNLLIKLQTVEAP